MVVRSASGGMLRHLKDLVHGLDERGYDVEIAGPCEIIDEFSQYACHLVAITDGINPSIELRAIARLALLVRRGEYDLIHLHGYKAAFLGCVSVRLARSTPILITAHNSWPFTGSSLSHRVSGLLSGFSLRRCSRVIAVSGAVRYDIIHRAGVRDHRVITIYNGIRPVQAATASFEIGELMGDKTFVVGTVARLIPAKGISDLLEAAKRVKEEAPYVCFLIAGDGPYKEAFIREQRNLGLGDTVFFLGHRDDVPDILSRLDLFLLPSHSEGLPLTILEAMAAGKAVLATRVGGIPEVIVHGENGLLVPPNSPGELASGILKLMADRELLTSLGERGRKTFIEGFTLERMIDETESLYRKAMGFRSP